MIFQQNWEVTASFLFYLLAKFICYFFANSLPKAMHNRHSKHPKLSSIPERNEIEEEHKTQPKWVPKKKHDVLKAKYKCLKKLFQIYDASVIGILPEQCGDSQAVSVAEESQINIAKRKKRSNRTITDACAGTTDQSIGDTNACEPAPSCVLRDLKIQCSCSTQFCSENTHLMKDRNDGESARYVDSDKESLNATEQNYKQQEQNFCSNYFNSIAPYLQFYEKRKPTRFQNFLSRIFGFKRERCSRNYVAPKMHIYAASDTNYNDRRRRKGLRFRKMKNTKKVHSEIAVRDLRSPMLLSYVQSVQKHCLMDNTQRQCPFSGCCNILYGIINYNDHLNLCHFSNHKYSCHYCHEGFGTEYEKFVHENEHLGISRLHNAHIISATSTGPSIKKVEVTQTDPEPRCEIPEEKLKKIVSFFDKIVATDMLAGLKKNKLCCESLHGIESSKATSEMTGSSMSSDDKRTVSCGNLMRRKPDRSKMTVSSDMTRSPGMPIKCWICGENFDYRRQLSLHMDLEHRAHDKFSKFHSCAGLSSYRPQTKTNMATAPGNINIQTIKLPLNDATGSLGSSSTSTEDYTESEIKDEMLSHDPSTNILCYESSDVKKATVWSNCNKNNNVNRVKNKLSGYQWEPGTQIIRV